MARKRKIPPSKLPAIRQAVRRRYGPYDRIVIDDVDYRCAETTDAGHLFQAAHDSKITKTVSHDDIPAVERSFGYRYDHGWYAPGAAKARLKAGVALLSDLPFEERQYICWQVDFVKEFLKLKASGETTCGDDAVTAAIVTIDGILKDRASTITDNGRRPRAGRIKSTFDKPCAKSLLKWKNKLLKADFNPLVLRKRTDKSGNFTPRLTPEQYRIVARYAPRFATPLKPDVTELYKDMRVKIARINRLRKRKNLPEMEVPAIDKLYEQIGLMSKFRVMAGREGLDVAKNHFRAVTDGLQDVEWPLQQVEADHWSVQLITLLVWSGLWDYLPKNLQEEVKRVRMVLGVAIDRRTHCILAMKLSRTASVESAIALVEMAVTEKQDFADGVGALTPWDYLGHIDALITDGGSAFIDAIFKTVLADLKIDHEIPPSGLAHLRGMVERIFRSMHEQVVARFEGRTFEDVVRKGDYDAEGRAGLTVDELGEVLIRYAVDIHHNTPLEAIGWETPRSCWLRLTAEHAVEPGPDVHLRRHVFGIEDQRTLGPAGIRVLNIQYRSEKLHDHFNHVGEAKVAIRALPENLGAISVKIDGSWLTVPARKEFWGVDADTWIAAEADLRRRGKHLARLTMPIVLAAIEANSRVAARARKRRDIGDTTMSKAELLRAEGQMKIGTIFPDPATADGENSEPGDHYDGTVMTGTPAPPNPAAGPATDAATGSGTADRPTTPIPTARRPNGSETPWIIEEH
jgi:putative transposase